jgi:hypothetical protein
VQQHARAVENAGQPQRGGAGETLCGGRDDPLSREAGVAGAKGGALLVDRGDDMFFDRCGAKNGNEPRDARLVEYAVDGRRPAVLRR